MPTTPITLWACRVRLTHRRRRVPGNGRWFVKPVFLSCDRYVAVSHGPTGRWLYMFFRLIDPPLPPRFEFHRLFMPRCVAAAAVLLVAASSLAGSSIDSVVSTRLQPRHLDSMPPSTQTLWPQWCHGFMPPASCPLRCKAAAADPLGRAAQDCSHCAVARFMPSPSTCIRRGGCRQAFMPHATCTSVAITSTPPPPWTRWPSMTTATPGVPTPLSPPPTTLPTLPPTTQPPTASNPIRTTNRTDGPPGGGSTPDDAGSASDAPGPSTSSATSRPIATSSTTTGNSNNPPPWLPTTALPSSTTTGNSNNPPPWLPTTALPSSGSLSTSPPPASSPPPPGPLEAQSPLGGVANAPTPTPLKSPKRLQAPRANGTTANDDDDNASSHSSSTTASLSGGAIAGIAVGCVACAGAVGFFVWRKKKATDQEYQSNLLQDHQTASGQYLAML
ncbi:Aste57867_13579 [Aphanomyces stellatus]|uniref:Aste57867_13579 protein n=1 Tax=Aphanomyces stellatus TaxID=120398 RepID=A0A485KYI1_9STRA|nr:hypothetical protein As57867_013529 [Aphanomyces stellatus]VFT90417.1 Aste57867_13579 [Aphanomyces stellatus]